MLISRPPYMPVGLTRYRRVSGFRSVSPVEVIPPPSGTATLWVNWQTGSDAWTYDEVRTSGGLRQWASMGRASWGSTNRSAPVPGQAAQPGDVVSVAPGTYIWTGIINNKFSPVYLHALNGTLANPITFLADGGTVILENPNTLSPVLGQQNRDYITYRGPFFIDQVQNPGHSDTGPTVFIGATGCIFDGIRAAGIPSHFWNDNHNAVRMEGSFSCEVRNCEFYDWYDGNPGTNGTIFTLYGSSNCIIEHNRGYRSNVGLYFKNTGTQNPQFGNRVRYNYFSDMTNSIIRYSLIANGTSTEDRNFVYRNLGVNAANGLNCVSALNDWAWANTLIGMTNQHFRVSVSRSGVRYWSNICYGGALMVQVGSTMPAAAIHHNDYNCYFNGSGFYEGTDGSRSFSDYRAQYTDQDVNSIQEDPQFVDFAGGNYQLQPGSPARNLARDPETMAVIHAGCYQDDGIVIGIDS